MTDTEDSYIVYILKLKEGKYYIGKTKNAASRIAEHIRTNGSEWTKRYKPDKVIKLYKNCDSFDEDKYTVMYMAKYGIDNVRGGTFCSIVLDKETINVISKMIDSATDRCFKCGSKEHFAINCPKDKEPSQIVGILMDLFKKISAKDRNTTYLLLDEKLNEVNEIRYGDSIINPIPDVKQKFMLKLSKKVNSALFSYSMSTYDFYIKTLTDYDTLYNSNGVAVLISSENDLSEDIRKQLVELIEETVNRSEK